MNALNGEHGREMSCLALGYLVPGCGLWVVGCGLWVVGCGLWGKATDASKALFDRARTLQQAEKHPCF